MGRDAEERLVNFHEWREEVADKLEVAGVCNEKQKTTIALMWGGRGGGRGRGGNRGDGQQPRNQGRGQRKGGKVVKLNEVDFPTL